MRILVAGGAGYIGGFITTELCSQGFDVVVIDDLSTGHQKTINYVKERTKNGTLRYVQGDVRDPEALKEVWQEPIDGVIYLVGKIYVQEAAEDPIMYIEHNLGGVMSFLNFMLKETPTRSFVFSSSGTVYGEVPSTPVGEEVVPNPTNPYSESKWATERMCSYLETSQGLNWMALRYFNASGGALDGSLGEEHPDERHLIPLVLRACKNKGEFSLFGTDYPTEDGTTVRDYVHVLDLATAHIAALKALEQGPAHRIYNVGTGKGLSVKEIVAYAQSKTGVDLDINLQPRREGDVAYSVARADRIKKDLHWEPKYSNLETVIDSAWAWMNR